jgi:hypothetical protein
MSWIDDELANQARTKNAEEKLASLAERLWEYLAKVLDRDGREINARLHMNIEVSKDVYSIYVKKDILPAFYIRLKLDIPGKSIRIERERVEWVDQRGATSTERIHIALGAGDAIVLSRDAVEFTPEQLSAHILRPIVQGWNKERMRQKGQTESEKFNKVMDGLLAVPYSELQKKLEQDRKAKTQKKRATSSPASRAASSGKKSVA